MRKLTPKQQKFVDAYKGSVKIERTVFIWGKEYTESQARGMFCNPNVEMSLKERGMRGQLA